MRLRSVEVIPYALPFKEPYVTARGVLMRREMVLLRIRDDDGFVGLGEAVPLSLRGGTSLSHVVRELEELAAGDVLPYLFEDRTLGIVKINEIDPRLSLSAPSSCALLTAIEDLDGRYWEAEGRPTARSPVYCNATLVAGEPTAVADDALRWAADGFNTFKLKLGTGSDVDQVRAVREALGPRAKLRLDANAAWTLDEATQILAELEPLEIELVEQPVATIEEAARLSERTTIPLAGDESIASLEDARRAVELKAFQCAAIKVSKVGSVYEAMQIAETIPSYASSALDGPVGIVAGVRAAEHVNDFSHLYAENYAHGLATQRLFASTIAAVECELRDGMLHPPPGPGLGVEIDEDALRAHRL